MDKVSISRFTEKVIEQHGSDSAEAVLIIAITGNQITTSCVGLDPLLINDKSVILAGAMRTVLDEKFKLANAMFDRLKQNGRIRTEMQEKLSDINAEDLAADPAKEQSKPDLEDEFFHGLFDLLEHTFGGGKDAHDD